MRFIPRALAGVLRTAVRQFPAVLLTGPGRAGKTTLLRELFPHARYVLLEDPDLRARVRSDPRAFLDELRPPVILDEIQNAPELLNYVRTLIDQHPRATGRWPIPCEHCKAPSERSPAASFWSTESLALPARQLPSPLMSRRSMWSDSCRSW